MIERSDGQMAVGIVIIIALGVGTHVFEMTMKAAATQASLSKQRMFALGGVFGSIQMLLMLLGLMLTWLIEVNCEMDVVNRIYRNIALLCLFLLIVKGLFEGIHIREFRECRAEALTMKQWVLLAVRAGVEASIVGMSITYLNPDTLYDMVCVLCISILAAVSGLWYGYWSGVKGQRTLNLGGALLLAVAGVYMIIQHNVGF
jgi:putative Mn2+ efflux pump MntP